MRGGARRRGRHRPALVGRRLPPLVLIHGDLDLVVSFESARAAAGLWVDLLPDGVTPSARRRRSEARNPARGGPSRLESRRPALVRLLRCAACPTAGAAAHPGRRSPILT